MNEYSDLGLSPDHKQSGFLPVRTRIVKRLLKQLCDDSACGPDLITTRILKKFADVLALPISLISRAVLRSGCWPSKWKVHWIHPLFKKNQK